MARHAEQFSFFLMQDGEARLYRLRQDWIDFGGDYTLYDQTGAKVGRLEGHFFNAAGCWDVSIDAGQPAQLAPVLQLVSAMLKLITPPAATLAASPKGLRRAP